MPFNRARCPLCNGLTTDEHGLAEFVVCTKCAEILTTSELVRRATRATRRKYIATQTTTTEESK